MVYDFHDSAVCRFFCLYHICLFEYDDGLAVYEIDFISAGIEYEMTVKAADGSVVVYDTEILHTRR